MAEETIVKFKRPKSSERHREKIPCLIVLEGSNIGETYYLSKTSVVLGRGEKSDVFLPEDGVSRSHSRIDLHEGTYTIIDMGSTNGTFLNGDPVEQAQLEDGDKVRLGEVILKFSFQDIADVDFQARLRNMAMRDGLTKLFNRRYFTDSLEREISFALRKRQALSLILLDIDHFKKINDTYGHPAGDFVLKGIAKRLLSEIRSYDILARYGGEEFVLLLRMTPLDNAILLAERLRKVVDAEPFEFEGKPLSATMSVGVSSLDPDHATSAEDVLKQADRFMYEAKETGRNRVVSSRNTELIRGTHD